MKKRVTEKEGNREELSPAESSSYGRVDEVHSGADSVRLVLSRIRVTHVTCQRERRMPFIRVEPRIIFVSWRGFDPRFILEECIWA